MKLAAHQVQGVLRAPTQYAGLLVYGEDWGAVRSRSLAAVRAVVGGDASPFRHSVLTREEHGRLRDEATSLTLGGGRRVIHVQDATDALTPALEKLALRPEDVLVVVEAGELQARSKLRAFAERQPAWAAIACYLGNAGQLAAEIRAVMAEAGLTLTADALAFLAQELAGESTTRRSALEKLCLFAAGEGTVDADTARLCCSQSIETSLGAVVAAAMAGRADRCDALLAELAREGATGAGLLAVLSNLVQRFFKVRLMIDAGQGVEEACRSLSPPLYPRQAASFMQDVQLWRATALEGLAEAIRQADIACKRAGSPDLTIASRLVAAVASRRTASAA